MKPEAKEFADYMKPGVDEFLHRAYQSGKEETSGLIAKIDRKIDLKFDSIERVIDIKFSNTDKQLSEIKKHTSETNGGVKQAHIDIAALQTEHKMISKMFYKMVVPVLTGVTLFVIVYLVKQII